MSNNPVVEKYEDSAGEWRWRLRAGNGEIIATGSEGYVSKANVDRAINTVTRAFDFLSSGAESKEVKDD